MSYIFELPLYFSFLVFVCIGIFIYFIGYFFVHIFSLHANHDPSSIPIGAFIGTIATAWALSLGFVAADIWSINSKADQATNEERSSISRLYGLASPDILNSEKLIASLLEYSHLVSKNEWLEQRNTLPMSAVETVLQEIRREIVSLSKTDIPFPIIFKILMSSRMLEILAYQ